MYKLEKYKHKLMQINGGGSWLVSKLTDPYLNDADQKRVYKQEYLKLKRVGGAFMEVDMDVFSTYSAALNMTTWLKFLEASGMTRSKAFDFYKKQVLPKHDKMYWLKNIGIQIYSTNGAFAALKKDGTVTCWGKNDIGGQLPENIEQNNVKHIFSIDVGFAALMQDGSIRYWGKWEDVSSEIAYISFHIGKIVQMCNNWFEDYVALMQDGSIQYWNSRSTNLSKITGTFVQICSNHGAIAALKEDGTIQCWGKEVYGGKSPKSDKKFLQICSVDEAFAALKEDGTIQCWGNQDKGGQSPNFNQQKVVQIFSSNKAFFALMLDMSIHLFFGERHVPLTNIEGTVVQICSTLHAVAALKEDGTVQCWGKKDEGGQSPDITGKVVQICSNHGALAALKEDGTIQRWGKVSYGGMPQDVSTSPTSLLMINKSTWLNFLKASDMDDLEASTFYKKHLLPKHDKMYWLKNIGIQIYSTNGAFAALKKDGTVKCWGSDSFGGQLPENIQQNNVKHICSTEFGFYALMKDGNKIPPWGGDPREEVQCWGNVYEDRSTLWFKGKILQMCDTYTGMSAALMQDGSIEFRGGISTQIGPFVQICSNRKAIAALKEDGTVLCWGDQLPDFNQQNVVQICSTDRAFAALKDDGTVQWWGGIVGKSPEFNQKVVQIYSTDQAFFALMRDMSIQCFFGGSMLEREKAQIPEIEGTVVQICSTFHAFAALKEDGSVQCWGKEKEGGKVPIFNKNVVQICSTNGAFAALKEDGTIQCWGHEAICDKMPQDVNTSHA